MTKLPIYILLILFTLLSFTACSHDSSERYAREARLADSCPAIAVGLLDSLRNGQLDEDDRAYINFLYLKARDKAFLQHTSDSIVLQLSDYLDSHDPDWKAEGLYTAGRIYSDFGDYPTALEFYNRALELLQETPDLKLKSKLLSQTACIMTDLRLYDQAIPLTKQAIEISRQLGDSINEVYDKYQLSVIYLAVDSINSASIILQNVLDSYKAIPKTEVATTKMYLAKCRYNEGLYREAAQLISESKNDIDSLNLNYLLSLGCYTFIQTQQIDSAYIYATELINATNNDNKHIGFHTILLPEVRQFLSQDSVLSYTLHYGQTLEANLNNNSAEAAIVQQSKYNYHWHERKRTEAERSKLNASIYLCIALLCIIVLVCIILIIMLRLTRKRMQLKMALQHLDVLQSKLEHRPLANNDNLSKDHVSRPQDNSNVSLREQLRQKLFQLCESTCNRPPIPDGILTSTVYERLTRYADNGNPIPDYSPLWHQLHRLIEVSSCNYKEHLNILTGGKLSTDEFNTTLLIKCGFSPSQIATLLGRHRNSIVSRRSQLGLKIFGTKMPLTIIDTAICLL